jgi:ATP-dependent Clp protease protease subunit
LNTLVVEKTENGDVVYDIFSKLTENRLIFIQGFIDDRIASDVVAALLYLDLNDKKNKITLCLNSEGGDIKSVMMIYDILKLIKSPIETICIGSSMFESLLILAAGHKGMRYATQNSTMCLDQISHSEINYSDLTNAEISHNQSKEDNSKFLKELAKCMGKTVKEISLLCDRQLFLNSKDAKKYKIIDKVIKGF